MQHIEVSQQSGRSEDIIESARDSHTPNHLRSSYARGSLSSPEGFVDTPHLNNGALISLR